MANTGQTAERRLGAYGLRLAGVDEVASLLVQAREEWPRIELVSEVGKPNSEPERVTSDEAILRMVNGGRIAIDRLGGRAVFTHSHRLEPAEIVHPYLAPAASIIGRWLGRESFHAGAFVSGGGVWALLGDRESGKSSMLGWLALNGHEIVCDDMLILEGTTALLGPRSIDLRPEAARLLEAGEPLGTIGTRERWRLSLGEVEGPLPMKGWIVLAWGEAIESNLLPSAELLGRLVQQRAVRLPSADPGALLDLAALPGWELRRPRRLSSLPDTAGHLLERLAE
jgi:hypothetical protein